MAPVLRIRDILVRIRIPGSIPVTWIRIRIGIRLRILIFSSVSEKMATKKVIFFCFLFFDATFSLEIKSHSQNRRIKVFLLFFLDDKKVESVRYFLLMDPDPGGPKHTDPTNPDPAPDPQHCMAHLEF
jgi:hypothetical protein